MSLEGQRSESSEEDAADDGLTKWTTQSVSITIIMTCYFISTCQLATHYIACKAYGIAHLRDVETLKIAT